MKNKSKKQKVHYDNRQRSFFKIFAAFFTVLIAYIIINYPMDVLKGIIDSLK